MLEYCFLQAAEDSDKLNSLQYVPNVAVTELLLTLIIMQTLYSTLPIKLCIDTHHIHYILYYLVV